MCFYCCFYIYLYQYLLLHLFQFSRNKPQFTVQSELTFYCPACVTSLKRNTTFRNHCTIFFPLVQIKNECSVCPEQSPISFYSKGRDHFWKKSITGLISLISAIFLFASMHVCRNTLVCSFTLSITHTPRVKGVEGRFIEFL